MANESTRSTLAGTPINALIEAQILSFARAKSVGMHCVVRKSLDPESSSISHSFAKFSTLAATSISDGTDHGPIAVTNAAVTLTAAMVGVTPEVTDIARTTADGGLTAAIIAECGYAIADKIDLDLAALAANPTNGVGTTGIALTVDAFLSAIYTLDSNNAPDGNPGDPTAFGGTPAGLRGKLAWLHPIHVYQLRSAMLSTEASFMTDPKAAGIVYGDEAGTVAPGFIGQFLGVNVFQNTNIPVANGTDRLGLMFVPSYMGIVAKWLIRMASQRNERMRSTVHAIDAFYGVGELVDLYGCKMLAVGS